MVFQDTLFVVPITMSLVIYQEQQQLTASKGCKNPCAQIHSRIDDHPTFWSHDLWKKCWTPYFSSFFFFCGLKPT